MNDGHDPPPFLVLILFEVDEMVTVECADGSHSQALRRVLQDGSIWYSTGGWLEGAATACCLKLIVNRPSLGMQFQLQRAIEMITAIGALARGRSPFLQFAFSPEALALACAQYIFRQSSARAPIQYLETRS